MNRYRLSICWILATSTILQASDDTLPLFGKSFFATRSQGVNSALEALGWYQFINRIEQGLHVAFVIAPVYSQAYKTGRIAEYFFGTDTLTISGSTVPSRGDNDILADYFGLPTDYSSTVYLRPYLHNTLLDSALYLRYNGFYLYVHIPYAWAKSGIELQEDKGLTRNNAPYPPYYMAQDAVLPPAQSFKQAMTGGYSWGNISPGLSFSKIGDSALHQQGIADIDFAIGWNFLRRERGVVGIALRLTAPTGNASTAEYLFEPMIGNGRHWQWGGCFNAQGLIWEKDGEQFLHFVVQTNVTTMLNADEVRSFDLKTNSFGSRYILAKQFDNLIYTGNTQPLVNISTLPCKIRNAAQIDCTLMFAYEYMPYNACIGYNGWGRTADGVVLKECFPGNTWGLKGIANEASMLGLVPDTQSSAKLHGNFLSEQALVIDSNSPVIITGDDLNLRSGAASRNFTNKIFAYGNYTWCGPKMPVHPGLGLGFSVEFEGIRPKNVSPNKNNLSQWAVWLRGEVSF